ncbi:YkgJ family cysteine cluster protein [Xenophilus sp. Marseille-Q4582]|uniref:YkgJ family cysteine cluster protein n=1 Tax=Xenophilus sp. Marseille-Q4582 TaxID=2866600 RepID=UPI001CE4694F|nr:YkgJ family cysteine cluster protein [Xenophilus sp. Marseille-Q4582]
MPSLCAPPVPRFECRSACAACCIAPSISSPIPGMPQGKPAGVPCVQLDEQLRCRLFGRPERPAVCGGLQPSPEMCGSDRAQALQRLAWLEAQTAPAP